MNQQSLIYFLLTWAIVIYSDSKSIQVNKFFSLDTLSSTLIEKPSGTLERKFSIKLESTLQLSNNSVGFDWNNFLSIDERIVKKGESIEVTIKKRAPLIIEAHAIEEDAHYPDAGKKTMTIPYTDILAIEDMTRFEIDVMVIENGGQYAGNTAKWKFIFTITKL